MTSYKSQSVRTLDHTLERKSAPGRPSTNDKFLKGANIQPHPANKQPCLVGKTLDQKPILPTARALWSRILVICRALHALARFCSYHRTMTRQGGKYVAWTESL